MAALTYLEEHLPEDAAAKITEAKKLFDDTPATTAAATQQSPTVVAASPGPQPQQSPTAGNITPMLGKHPRQSPMPRWDAWSDSENMNEDSDIGLLPDEEQTVKRMRAKVSNPDIPNPNTLAFDIAISDAELEEEKDTEAKATKQTRGRKPGKPHKVAKPDKKAD